MLLCLEGGDKMEFQLTVRFNGESEGDMASFLQFIETNYPTQVHDASADSVKFTCHASLVIPSLAECITTVGAFKAQFTITYRLVINQ